MTFKKTFLTILTGSLVLASGRCWAMSDKYWFLAKYSWGLTDQEVQEFTKSYLSQTSHRNKEEAARQEERVQKATIALRELPDIKNQPSSPEAINGKQN